LIDKLSAQTTGRILYM